MSTQQLLRRITQLQKVVNHPKTVLFQAMRDRRQALNEAKAAVGAEFAGKKQRLLCQQALLASSSSAMLSSSLSSSLSSLSSEEDLSAESALRLLPGSDDAHGSLEEELTDLKASTRMAAFVGASGKLAVLDRLLLRCRRNHSRVLLFSQFTLTLDCLEEYCTARVGLA